MSETRTLASFVVNTSLDDIPRDVRDEARRAILNYVGCALGGCREPAMEVAIQALGPFFGAPTASVLGREERMDPLHASLMNGISSHVHDYDDTTPGNYSHPTSPVASALFAFASANRISGRDFMRAFILGFGDKVGVTHAALANGTFSQALEYDDTHNESIVHMSSPSVASALALSEVTAVSGRDFIAAIAVGNEIACRRSGSFALGPKQRR